MSLKSRETRKLAAASATALVALGAAAATPAMADTSTVLNYQCTIPLIDVQPVVVANVKTTIPTEWVTNTLTPKWQITVQAFSKGDTYSGLQTVGAASAHLG